MIRVLPLALLGIWVLGAANATEYTFCNVYSCNSGYYAVQPTFGNTRGSCQRCPAQTRADGALQYGTTASNGASSVSGCCIPTGVKYKDTTGEFELTAQCCAS
ncbi:MAG: hypothetical protein K2I81_01510 [Alphaproteobacteria bacterium]|nr:hypothetical protein [Alphaproteobacteria bacterium]